MKRTAIYIRVSTDTQVKEGDSIPAQRDALTRYVSDRSDLELMGEYVDEGVSGRKYDRDELQRMLDDVQAGKIDLILVTKLDRLFRSLKWYIRTQEILDKHKVDWLAIHEPIYDTTTPSGRLIVNQMMSISQFEAENTSLRIKSVFRYKAEKGEVLSGRQPLGFSIVDKHLTPNEDADIVRDLFRLFRANPNYCQLARYANSKYGIAKKQSNWKKMLRETKYIGVYKGISGYCDPIIPLPLFEAVQNQIQCPAKASARHTYIFSGLLYCSECGCTMTGTSRPDGYLIYRCQQHYKAIPSCGNQKTIYERTLEKELLARIRDDVQGVIDAEVKERKVDPRKKVKALKRKIDRLKELYINDLISLDEYKADRERIEHEITMLSAPYSPKLDGLKDFIGKDVETLYKGFTPEEKRMFWRSIVRKIRMDANRQIVIEFA